MANKILRDNALALVGLLVIGYVPIVLSSTQLASATTVVAFAIALVSLNVLLGSAGQISLGQFAFVGTGAFLTLQLGARGWPQPAAILVGALGVAAVAALVGLPSLRIKGLAVAIGTLVYGIAANKYLFNQPWFTGSDRGLSVDVAFMHGDAYQGYLIALGFLVLVLLLDQTLRKTKLGRAFVVTRDGEERAVAFGVEPGMTKLRAYALSGFIAGIAGGVILYLGGQASADDFTVLQSLELLSFAVLAGAASRHGSILAAGLLIGVPLFFPPPDARVAPLFGGLLLVVFILFLPEGLGGLASRARKWFRHRPFAIRIGVVNLGLLLAGMAVIAHDKARLDDADYESSRLAIALVPLALLAAAYWFFADREAPDDGQVEVEGALATGADAVQRATKAAANAVVVREVPRELSLRMPTRVMFEASNVGVRFGGVQALDNINLEVRQGEIIGLIGANGAGKSTFYNVVSGFVTPTEGSSLKYKGRELLDFPASVRTKWGIARTFQHMGLIRNQTVEDNVLLAQHWLANYDEWLGVMKMGGSVRTEAELRFRAELALEIFGLEQYRGVRLGSLPYGTMRMCELASAVASGSDLLFFDEASAGLAPDEAHGLADRFLALRAELGLSLVVIEHHVPLIARTCDYVYCLASGRQLAEGEPSSVQSNPEVVAEFLGRSQIKTTPKDVPAATPAKAAATGATARKATAKKATRKKAATTVVKKTTAKSTAAKKATKKKAVKKAAAKKASS